MNIGRTFSKSRYLIIIAVIVSACAAILLYLTSLHITYRIILDTLQSVPATGDEGKRLAVRLLKVLDIVLIAVTFHILSAGLTKLFITPRRSTHHGLLRTLRIESLHDLKSVIIQISVVIMTVAVLEQVVEVGATLETLYLALACAVAAAAFAWATQLLGRSESDNTHLLRRSDSDKEP